MSTFQLLTIARRAEAAIAPHRLVVPGTGDGLVIQATGPTTKLLGVTDQSAVDPGDHVDTHVGGVATVEYGGNVAFGDPLTSDAQGRAVVATVAGSRVAGIANEAGDLGTLGSILLAPSTLAGA